MNTNLENTLRQTAEKNCAYGIEFVGGSLFAKFTNQLSADKCHIALKKAVDKDTGVNMYELRDSEYVFDFVPVDREAPVFMDKDKIDELYRDMPGDVETSLQLEIEASQGR
jgi:hypothetical protein